MNASVVDEGDSLATASMVDGGVAESTAVPGAGDEGDVAGRRRKWSGKRRRLRGMIPVKPKLPKRLAASGLQPHDPATHFSSLLCIYSPTYGVWTRYIRHLYFLYIDVF